MARFAPRSLVSETRSRVDRAELDTWQRGLLKREPLRATFRQHAYEDSHMTVTFEPLSTEWRDDPYSVYQQLREHDPVHWAPEAKAFCISRYDDVVHVLRNADLFSSEAMGTELMSSDFGRTQLRHLPRVARFMWRARPENTAKRRLPRSW